MNRRSFLRALASGIIAASTVDVDRLLWERGKKAIFLPPAPLAPLADTGISIRFIKDLDGLIYQPARLDVLYGFAVARPEMAVRIVS